MRVKASIKQKLNSKTGFTLAEMLLAILILLMVSAIVAAGIPAAREAYTDVVIASNAEVALSTTMAILRSEIGAGTKVDDTNENGLGIKYYSSLRGTMSRIYLDSAGKDIKLQRYLAVDGIGKSTDAENLISTRTATNNLHVTCGGVSYSSSSGIVTFTDIEVKRENKDKALASRDSFSIRILSEK